MRELMRKPLAWIPIALPVGIIAMLLYALATQSPVPAADEGIEAHLFQLWIVLECVLVSVFAAVWLPRAPRAAGVILVLQLTLSFVPIAAVFYFRL